MLEVLTYSDGVKMHIGAGQILGSDSGAQGHSCTHASCSLINNWTLNQPEMYSDACARNVFWDVCACGFRFVLSNSHEVVKRSDNCDETCPPENRFEYVFWKFAHLLGFHKASHESCETVLLIWWIRTSGFIDFSLTSVTISCILIQDDHAVEQCWRYPADDPREDPDITRVFTGASRSPGSSRYTTVINWQTHVRYARLKSPHMSLGCVRRSRTRRPSRIEGPPRASWSQGLDGTKWTHTGPVPH